MRPTIHPTAAAGFEAAASAYEHGRPEYAPKAIDRLVRELGIGPGARVLDLAAGTGKLTRMLLPTGAEVVAVEPVEAMRAELARRVHGVDALAGTAESIPLPDRSVYAVTVGQAFHWFDGDRALSEIHRVLRPGGALGLIWQAREPARPWIQRLEELIDIPDDGNPRFRTGRWRDAFERSRLFSQLEHAEFETVQRGDADVFVDRIASISYVARLPAEPREAILDEVRHLLATDADTAGSDAIELPYRAHVYWTRALDRAEPISS